MILFTYYNYYLIFFFFIISIIVSLVLGKISYQLAPKNYYINKTNPYECGFKPFNTTRESFNVDYYVIAVLFLIFDIEVALIFPWTLNLKSTGNYGLISMFIFFFLIYLGFVFEWQKGALNW